MAQVVHEEKLHSEEVRKEVEDGNGMMALNMVGVEEKSNESPSAQLIIECMHVK